MLRSLVFSLIFLCTFSAHAKRSCYEDLNPGARTVYAQVDQLGFTPEIAEGVTRGFDDHHYSSFALNPQTKEIIGTFKYHIDDFEPDLLQIDSTDIKLQRLGIYEDLLATAVRLRVQVEALRAYYVRDNLAAAEERFKSLQRDPHFFSSASEREEYERKKCEEAVLSAPSAKAALRLGFTKIVEAHCNQKREGFYIIQARE